MHVPRVQKRWWGVKNAWWGLKTHAGGWKCIAGGQDTWLGSITHGKGSRMHGRDRKCVVEVENVCWEGLVTWWAVEGLEHMVGGVKVVMVVVVGCIVVLLVAISIVDTQKNISRVLKKTKKTYLGLETHLHLKPQSSLSLLSCSYHSLLLYTYPSNNISKAITLKKKTYQSGGGHIRVAVVIVGGCHCCCHCCCCCCCGGGGGCVWWWWWWCGWCGGVFGRWGSDAEMPASSSR